MTILFRLVENLDPEERLEEAALWKAMHDEYGDGIVPLTDDEDTEHVAFGRMGRSVRNYVSDNLAYWDDPAFLRHAQRRFCVVDFDGLENAISDLHAAGFGAFVKSTRSKHYIVKIPVGTTVADAMDAMAYSFMDGGPRLMVQQLIEPTYETRFFCIGREIVTSSPICASLTPLDFPYSPYPQKICDALRTVARDIASAMQTPHASIDCAMTDGKPGVIELNPMILGNLGLYACDVRALARASRKLIEG